MAEKSSSCVREVFAFIVAFILGASLCALYFSEFKSSEKIASVDVQVLANNSSQVIALQKEYQLEIQKLQEWLNSVKLEVESELNEDKQKELLDKYNQEYALKQANIKAAYDSQLKRIDENITRIIHEEAKNLGYDIIINKSSVLVGTDNITEEIIKKIQ